MPNATWHGPKIMPALAPRLFYGRKWGRVFFWLLAMRPAPPAPSPRARCLADTPPAQPWHAVRSYLYSPSFGRAESLTSSFRITGSCFVFLGDHGVAAVLAGSCTPGPLGSRSPSRRTHHLGYLLYPTRGFPLPAAPTTSTGRHRARRLGTGGTSRRAGSPKEPRHHFLRRKDWLQPHRPPLQAPGPTQKLPQGSSRTLVRREKSVFGSPFLLGRPHAMPEGRILRGLLVNCPDP